MKEFEHTMKECCGLCPYSRKDTLILSPERAEDFANAAENPYNDFVCHKTAISLEESDFDDRGGDLVRGEKSLTCMGFASMQQNINGGANDNYRIDPNAFEDAWEMIEHHTDNEQNK
jgi:hypothetical protein